MDLLTAHRSAGSKLSSYVFGAISGSFQSCRFKPDICRSQYNPTAKPPKELQIPLFLQVRNQIIRFKGFSFRAIARSRLGLTIPFQTRQNFNH
ncbi:hypothetical protein N9734_00315 [Alphaproteobacteria bacterium]|nr:hypothetical protein [Alphaproteobacteria bacterium]